MSLKQHSVNIVSYPRGISRTRWNALGFLSHLLRKTSLTRAKSVFVSKSRHSLSDVPARLAHTVSMSKYHVSVLRNGHYEMSAHYHNICDDDGIIINDLMTHMSLVDRCQFLYG